MNKTYLFAVIAFVIALAIPFALSAITSITLVSPADNAWTNDTTPNFNFSAISDTDATFSCSLYVDAASVATNPAVANNTYTILTASTLSQGSRSWYINCTDTGGTVQSSTRTLNIDSTAPSVTLSSPSNNSETSSHSIDFEFKAIDNLDSSMSCKLYINGSEEDTESAQNNTDEKFNNVNVDSGNLTWFVACEDNAGNIGQSETRILEVKSFCDEGRCGDIEISKIYDPDSGDDFYPGDNITVKIKIDNDYDEDLDVAVEAELYDMDEDDAVSDDEDSVTISDNDDETITLVLDVPYDIDESHDFVVRFKAYEDGDEDEHCDDDSISVKIKREKHSVSIERLELDQTTTACGGVASLSLKVANTGRNDEDVKIEVSSSIFNWTKSQFDLDKGDDYSVTIPVAVPEDGIEGTYTIDVKASYHYYSDSYHAYASSSKTLTVQGNCPPVPEPDASFSTTQTSDAFTGKIFTTKIAVTNTGNVKTNYTISASGYEGWASLSKVEPSTLTLNAGKTGYAYVSLKPYANATGSNSFTVNVAFDSTTKEETVEVEVKKQTAAAALIDRLDFEWNRNWYWVALIIVLIAVIIILAIILARQGTRYRRHPRYPAEIRLRTIPAKTEKLGKKLKSKRK